VNTFRTEAQAAHGAGFTYFDQLGGRQVDGGFEIWLRVMNPDTSQVRLIKAALGDELVSVADLWSGAVWAEAEFRRDFRSNSRRAADDLHGETVGGYTSSGVSAHVEEPK
jgi:hypothetical protein